MFSVDVPAGVWLIRTGSNVWKRNNRFFFMGTGITYNILRGGDRKSYFVQTRRVVTSNEEKYISAHWLKLTSVFADIFSY